MKRKVIDAFIFFNEFDLLKLRLEYLNDIVDYFIICESNYTFSGKEKPYYLDEILNELPENIVSKIHRLKFEPNISEFNFPKEVESYDPNNDIWKLERMQRNYITQHLTQFSPDDLFMLSDVDEIPNKEVILKFIFNCESIISQTPLEAFQINIDPNFVFPHQKLKNQFLYVAKCHMFYYDFLTFCHSSWPGTVFTNIENVLLLENGCDYFRLKKFELNAIENGGWHFSYFGGVEKIKTKIQSYSHQEHNKYEYTNEVNILNCIKNKKNIFNTNENFTLYDLNNYPENLKNLILKIYPNLKNS